MPFGYLGEDALTYPGDYGQPPRQSRQDEPWQPQEYDPVAYQQHTGPQQGPVGQQWPREQPNRQQQPYGQPWPPQDQQYAPQLPPWQQQSAMPPQTPKGQRRKSWPARHKVLTGLIAFGALVVIGAAASASNKPSTTASDTGVAGSSASASASSAAASSALGKAAAPAASSPQSKAAAPASPSMTTAQQQAVEAAQGYLGMGSGFSDGSLLNQLTSSAGNGFAKPDAEFAIKYLNPNWDQQAVDAAQGYLGMGSGFSDQGLVKQLTSSAGNGFTEAQAEYAINHLHPDWDAQAVDAAKGYMRIGGFSRASLIQQLTSSYGSGFTEAQAEYAASQAGL
jgi:hypothetical protein